MTDLLGCAAHLDWKSQRTERTFDRMRHVDHHLARSHVIAGECLFVVVNRTRRHASGQQCLDPLMNCAPSERRLQRFDQLNTIGHAQRIGCEAWI
jgi:hypothetical protein